MLNRLLAPGCDGLSKVVFAAAGVGTPLYVAERLGACGECSTSLDLSYAYSVPTTATSLEILSCEVCGGGPGDDDDAGDDDDDAGDDDADTGVRPSFQNGWTTTSTS